MRGRKSARRRLRLDRKTRALRALRQRGSRSADVARDTANVGEAGHGIVPEWAAKTDEQATQDKEEVQLQVCRDLKPDVLDLILAVTLQRPELRVAWTGPDLESHSGILDPVLGPAERHAEVLILLHRAVH